MRVATSGGFSWEIDPEAYDDMEMIDDLAALDAGDGGALLRVSDRLLGAEGKRALYDHLRDDRGRVPRKAFGEAMAEIIRESIPKNV